MKNIIFKNISIKNFLSFGNDEVRVDFEKGIHVITGVNRDRHDRQNGVGKSGLAESLYFAIFGTTIRELKKELIHNSYTDDVCRVILNFDVDDNGVVYSYKIDRTLNPSSLHFYKNDEDVTRDTIRNTEEDIHSVIAATPSIFENCIIMTLNNTTPFMAKSKVEKRKFIEGIFNLDVFSKMLGIARDDYNQEKRLYEIELSKMEQSSNNLNSLNSQRENILTSRKEKLEKYENRKQSNISEIAKLTQSIKDDNLIDINSIKSKIKKLNDGSDLLESRIEEVQKNKYTLISSNTQFTKNLEKVGTSEDICPMCIRPIASHDRDMIEEERVNIKTQISGNLVEIKNLESSITKCNEKKKSIKDALNICGNKINEYALSKQREVNTKERIGQLNEWLTTLDEDMISLKNEKTDLDSLIDNQTSSLSEIKGKVNIYRSKMNVLDTVKFVVSEEGVKSYIVNRILELFNSRISYYLEKMQANCQCFFNEYFEEQIINEKKKLCSYFNFSGAERKAIDFACLFSFMDMRRFQGDVSYNVSIYDELFDSCLDEQGVGLITDIIEERVNTHNECALIISHRKESIKAVTGNVIFLEKKNGITRKVNHDGSDNESQKS